MRRLLAAVGGAVLAASFLVAPAVSVQAAEDVSYLFVVDSTDIRVTPLKGDAARVEITGAAVTQFTDRPEREAERIGVRGMLREFGWTRASKRLKGSTPNASISIAGERSQIVDLKRARVGDGRVVLRVKGINGPLESMAGAGSVFVDSSGFPQTQDVQLIAPRDPSGPPVASATVVLNNPSSATITVQLTDIDPGLTAYVIDYELGNDQQEAWSENGYSFGVQISGSTPTTTALVNITLEVRDTTGANSAGVGQVFFAW